MPPWLSTLEGVTITNLVCGSKHTPVLSQGGILYSWGYNQFGMIEADPCINVAAGGCHSAATSKSGRLYTWGRGFIGQLGLGHRIEEDGEHFSKLPQSVEFVKDNDGAELAQRVARIINEQICVCVCKLTQIRFFTLRDSWRSLSCSPLLDDL